MVKMFLIGHIGKDAQMRYNKNQKQMVTFSVCHNEEYTDSKGEKQSKPQWFDIVLYGGENLQPYLTKGQQVYVEGTPNNYAWIDETSGELRVSNGMVCKNLRLI